MDITALVIGLTGGLALFLYGMDKLTESLKVIAGGGLKAALSGMTRGRFRAAFTGALVTAVIQSSSVTTVLVVGFVSAGLLSLAAAVGVIIGANVGTTVTAQIVAFKVTEYGLVLVTIGFAVAFLGKTQRVRHWGQTLLGLGLVFFGMDLMSQATNPLRSYQPFIDAMGRMESPWLAIGAAAGFTALVQSSSATTGVVIVLASQGFITLEAGILLIFGANIGTCVTALIASVGKSRNAVRAALVHVLFNVLGVLLWVAFVEDLAVAVTSISPKATGLLGIERLAAETPRQIANAHTLFNVANTLIFIWFTKPLAWLVSRIVRESSQSASASIEPKYLDPVLLDTPELALDRVRLELGRLGEHTYDMVAASLEITAKGSLAELEALAAQDDDVDALHGAIIAYLGQLSLRNVEQAHTVRISEYMTAANHIENIGDMVETNLVEGGRRRLSESLVISEGTFEHLAGLHERVAEAVFLSLKALNTGDIAAAQQVVEMKSVLNDLLEVTEDHIANRLRASEKNRLELFTLETEMVEYLRRVYYFSKRIAKEVLLAESGGREAA
ncbi:MAG: Na/Pi cotransporter family protein [Rhodothermales bacterium]|nr:Na/Pi cotransporter family protein [Rhodothermales bacterium]MBO6781625.1 Na/Pi cotransporter family protein [Rhodothermales bacterium]